jgi:hypothetical protein
MVEIGLKYGAAGFVDFAVPLWIPVCEGGALILKPASSPCAVGDFLHGQGYDDFVAALEERFNLLQRVG